MHRAYRILKRVSKRKENVDSAIALISRLDVLSFLRYRSAIALEGPRS